MTDPALRALLDHPRYPRSSRYDPGWVVANQMGPNALWLMEALTEALPIRSDMRVLDLGCGRAMSSVFLAREFDARVVAADWWIDAEENRARVEAAGVSDLVTCVRAEAHQLPFDPGSFDAIVSVDAYQYFGTADLYLGTMSSFLKAGGRIGVVVPGVFRELGASVPEPLRPYWDWEFCCFHGPDWWRSHWAKTGLVDVERADSLPDGWRDWLRWEEVTGPRNPVEWLREAAARQVELLRIDRGELFGFARIVARKPAG